MFKQVTGQIVTAYLWRYQAAQPQPLGTFGEYISKIMYPADNSVPGNIKLSGQHVDTSPSCFPLSQGHDDQDRCSPVHLSPQEQT